MTDAYRLLKAGLWLMTGLIVTYMIIGLTAIAYTHGWWWYQGGMIVSLLATEVTCRMILRFDLIDRSPPQEE